MITATTYHGSLPLILAEPDPGYGDPGILDNLEWEILCQKSTWRFDIADLGFVHKDRIRGYYNMWVNSAIPKDEDGTHCIVSISAIGCIYQDEKRKRSTGTAGAQISLGPTEGQSWFDPSGTEADKWTIRDRILTVNDTYFSATEPDGSVVGTNIAPPEAPGTPAFLWGHLDTTFRANYPKGWILDDRQAIQHFRLGPFDGLWEVRDVYGFYQIANPE
jgi:hypothetical protein